MSATKTKHITLTDPGQDFTYAAGSWLRAWKAYTDQARKFAMSKAEVLTTAGAFEPVPTGPPGPVPENAVLDKSYGVFESRYGHLRPDFEKDKADAIAEQAAAQAEQQSLDLEIAAAPEWVKHGGGEATSPSPSPSSSPGRNGSGSGGAARPPCDGVEQGEQPHHAETPGGAVVAPSLGQKLLALLLLAVLLGLSSYAWVNTANLSVDVFQSWPRALLCTVPVFFAPWFAKLVLDLASKQWPSARPILVFMLVVLGIGAFGLFLFGYYQNVLANDSLETVFQRQALPVSPIGLQITSQVLYECCFGVFLVEKLLAILRSWSRRNPRRQVLQEKRLQASRRFNAAEARCRHAASSLAGLDSERDLFANLVLGLVRLKFRLRQERFDNLTGLGNLLDRVSEAQDPSRTGTAVSFDLVKFLRGRQGDNCPGVNSRD